MAAKAQLTASAVAEALFDLNWDEQDRGDLSSFVEAYFCNEQQEGSDGRVAF